MSSRIDGFAEPRFAAVRNAFAKNFAEHGEIGAALAVYWRGEPVVDLWGGVRDVASGARWERETTVCMMSVAKGIAATAMAMLHDRGLVDLDTPVARYWPDFGQAGKAAVTVRQAMSHLASVPVADAAQAGDIYDFEKMAAAIAAQEPLWPPGTTQVYHSATLGHIVGKILRGVNGRSLSRFIREDISGPLGARYFVGLTRDEAAQCATMIPSAGNVLAAAKRAPPDSLIWRSWKALPADEDFNSLAWRMAEIPSVNGHGTPRGIARIYGALARGGEIDGVRLVGRKSLEIFSAEQAAGTSPNSGLMLRMGMGYMLNSPPHRPMGPSMRSFGHSGAGGAQAFADPDNELGYCYCGNRMHDGIDIGMRAGSLIEATFACIA